MSSSAVSVQPVRPPQAAVRSREGTNGLRQRAVRALRGNGMAVAGLALLLVIVLAAVFAPLIAPHNPIEQDVTRKLLPPFWEDKGTPEFLLGTDQGGRDILSRIIWGARISLALGLGSTLLSSVIGVTLGLVAGYGPKLWGTIIMRVVDAQIAFPFLVLAIALISVAGPSIPNLVAMLAAFGWVQFARLVRGEVLSLREKEFVEAARGLGASGTRIVLRHLLPNALSPVIVIWTFNLAQIILVESALSFLGLGIRPPTPSWGSMLADGRSYLDTAWWLATFPGLAIMLTVLSVNLLGDALREIVDPRIQL